MLRIGVLVSERVLVTDAMLLDGRYFVELGPDRVLSELGRGVGDFPLVVTGRYPTLREGLAARLEDPGFRWSLPLADGERAHRYMTAWEPWLRMVEAGLIGYEPQPASEAAVEFEAPGFIPSGAEDLVEKLRVTAGRSRARRIIARSELEQRELDLVTTWWNGQYLRLLARNAQADWLSFDTSARNVQPGEVVLPIPSVLLQWAKDCPPAAIALACSATPKERQKLHAQPTGAKTRSLAYAATRVGSVPSRTRILRESAAKLAVASVLIVLGLPIWKFDALDNPWTWVAFAGLAIGTLPFGALRDLVGAMRRDATAQLVIHHTTEVA